jgi:hypothetical protein
MPGSAGWYLEPLYSYVGGALLATVRTGRAMSAMRFPEVPRGTAQLPARHGQRAVGR